MDTRRGVFLVADGLGGRAAGETASRIVADALPRMIEEHLRHARDEKAAASGLREAIVELSEQVRLGSRVRAGLVGMGSTVVVACLAGECALVAHMGDSRAYLLRDARLELLTNDHTLVRLLLGRGEITREEAGSHPARHTVSRYVGMEDVSYPDVRSLLPREGDRLLLCSDGLTDMVPDEGLTRMLSAGAETAATCRELIDAANEAGGRDNITSVLVDWRTADD